MAEDNLPLDRMIGLNLEGPADALEELLLKCSGTLSFPELPSGGSDGGDGPGTDLPGSIEKAADMAQIPLRPVKINAVTANAAEIQQFVSEFSREFRELQAVNTQAEEQVTQDENLLAHLRHLSGLNIRFEQLFSCRYLKVRFGRLPADSEPKMAYYGDRLFFFFPFSHDAGFIWGMYITTDEFRVEVDDIFSSLFFERVRIPDGVCGTPGQALETARKNYAEDTARVNMLREQLSRLLSESEPKLARFYHEARFLSVQQEIRRYANVISGRFYLTGFVGRESLKAMEKAVASVNGVKMEPLARR